MKRLIILKVLYPAVKKATKADWLAARTAAIKEFEAAIHGLPINILDRNLERGQLTVQYADSQAEQIYDLLRKIDVVEVIDSYC